MPKRMVVVDTETTGLNPNIAEVIQICAIALNEDFTPDKTIPPFHLNIKPRKFADTEEYKTLILPALQVNGIKFKDMADFMPADDAISLWEKWWQMCNKGEALEPVAQNWPFDRSFLAGWLGENSMKDYFSRHYRDTYSASRFLRDRCFYHDELMPFPEGHSLNKLCKDLGVKVEKFHSAFDDALATAECYRKMLAYTGTPRTAVKPIND